MSKQQKNKKFIDKLLSLFGFKRPNSYSVRSPSYYQSSRVTTSNISSRDSHISKSQKHNRSSKERYQNDDIPVLDDNFEIISKPNSKKKRKKSGTVLKVLLSGFLICVITGCIVVGSFMFYVFAFVDGTVDNDLDNLKLDYTSIIYATDSDTGKYVELTRLHGTENRLWVDSADMPKYLGKAFISAEDKRFETHAGVDWKRTFSAFANYIFHFWDSDQGGSTITQQLVKNITDDKEKSSSRKIREIMRAKYLESHYDKDVILECYLNTIHLGTGVDGVEVAANYYFDKNVGDLTLTQTACLAALTKSPEGYNPYNYPVENKNRRNWVLDEMYNNGYITQDECKAAKAADLGLRKKPSTVLSTTKSVNEEHYSYFTDAVIEDVISGLMKSKNYSYKYAEAQLFKGGYKIYTTVDLDVQKTLEETFSNNDNFMKVRTDSGDKPQAAMTVMDYKGHIVGIVGGRGAVTGNRVLNRATQSPRQTGSAIKPLTCYSPAIEYNKITYGSKMVDSPISKLESGEKVNRWPKNYTGRYSGTVSVLHALQQSMNTIPVKLVQMLGTQTSFNFATQRLGITTLYEKYKADDGTILTDVTESSLALGGSVKGVTTTELAAAYCAIGDLGTYYKPTTYTKVLDQQNKVVLQEDTSGKKAMSEETANIMCEMLQTVTTKGTATAAKFGSWPIMSKTGTTSDTKDRWFVGGTPYYMATCWFGMDSSESMRGLTSNPALKLWKAAMKKIHSNLKLKDFPQSDTVEYRLYCTDSGMCAKSGCKNTAYGWFKSSYHPACNIHSGTLIEAKNKPAQIGETIKSTKASEKTTVKTKITNATVDSTTKEIEETTKSPPVDTTQAVIEDPTKATKAVNGRKSG